MTDISPCNISTTRPFSIRKSLNFAFSSASCCNNLDSWTTFSMISSCSARALCALASFSSISCSAILLSSSAITNRTSRVFRISSRTEIDLSFSSDKPRRRV
uniref:Uncharacterized protein n=1 Tax=Opuntia streptacantha TaxID=393608 RepID=A0A7C8Z2D0_OPUST